MALGLRASGGPEPGDPLPLPLAANISLEPAPRAQRRMLPIGTPTAAADLLDLASLATFTPSALPLGVGGIRRHGTRSRRRS